MNLLAAFSGSRLSNAQTIISEFQNAGLPLSLALAAIVNANAESGLNASAAGDSGHSVGLFQINDLKGKRVFNGDRKDPVFNTRWIISEYKRVAPIQNRTKGGSSGQIFQGKETLQQAIDRDASVADLTELWAAYVERPDRVVSEGAARKAAARTLFPGVADLPGSAVNSAGAAIQRVEGAAGNAIGQVRNAIPWKWLVPFLIVGVGFFLIAALGARRATQPIPVYANPRKKRRARR